MVNCPFDQPTQAISEDGSGHVEPDGWTWEDIMWIDERSQAMPVGSGGTSKSNRDKFVADSRKIAYVFN